ncbi:MAG: ribonuclease P protein component [Gammaproteobacteria bacterium]|nr:ribonuclease P protein component [Gammaproteobacteria bacterium]
MISSNRFTRYQRLSAKADFKNIFSQPQKTAEKNLLALWKTNTYPLSRIGIVVGKKVSRSAVVRNRIKRVVRESYRLSNVRQHHIDIVVIARHDCGHLNRLELRKEINNLWKRLALQFQKSSLS